MPIVTAIPPLSLYIHIPWCVRKCPYCDFNSHEAKESLPEMLYVTALLEELDTHLPLIQGRQIESIFFGGGTPSLFSGAAIKQILAGVAQRLSLSKTVEITLEANPGTMEQARFYAYREAGINRLSLGIQSLQDDKLKALGRIHDKANALAAIQIAKQAGFTNFNLDIMHGLPNQTIEDAVHDVQLALSCQPTHFSWYQLTIEPNTLFYHQTPVLPDDELTWKIQEAGQACIKAAGFNQYEVSAYSLPEQECKHNRNYWEFGDYLGIGAGAHSKMTRGDTGSVVRFSQVKHPRDYLDASKRRDQQYYAVAEDELIFEFMLNALRLTEGVPASLFAARTGLPLQRIQGVLAEAVKRGLLVDDAAHIVASALGQRFLNDLIKMFFV